MQGLVTFLTNAPVPVAITFIICVSILVVILFLLLAFVKDFAKQLCLILDALKPFFIQGKGERTPFKSRSKRRKGGSHE